jgi:hypothetical protein
MTHMLSLLPVLACAAMMFGGGALVWLATRTPLGRMSWVERRARHADPKAQDLQQGSRS